VSDDSKKEGKSAVAPKAEPTPANPSLAGLMASGDKGATKTPRDLEAEALRAAERALADGEKALAAARAQLSREAGQAEKRRRRLREWVFLLLLAVNVTAMVVVAMLPSRAPHTPPMAAPEAKPESASPPPLTSEPVARRAFNEPWIRAQNLAEGGEFKAAIAVLEQYLADHPRMAPSQKLSVLQALGYYAGSARDHGKADEYRRKADALDRSHALPDDLVAEAQAAHAAGDQERLRRVWARFLLQQRQIPSSLYKHVAEAYLQLGDSYRQQAADAAEAARLAELKATADKLREAAAQPAGQPAPSQPAQSGSGGHK
jgi:tetratricopeptide (TPR) repeat protein